MQISPRYPLISKRRAQPRSSRVAALVAAAWPAFAAAQRSEVPAPHTVTPPSRLDGFPGSFNAAMVEPGHWTLDVLPFPGVSYGLHADATIRVGLVQLAAFAKGYGVSGELRYRLWHQRNNSVVTTFGGSLMHLRTKIKTDENIDPLTGLNQPVYVTAQDVRSVQVTVTGEHRWTPRSATDLTLTGGGVVIAAEQPVKPESNIMLRQVTSLQGAGVMLSHSYFPARWFGIDAGVGITPYLDASAAGSGGGADIDLTKLGKSRAGISGRFNLHVRSKHWLTTLGAVVLPPYIPVPVIGVARSW